MNKNSRHLIWGKQAVHAFLNSLIAKNYPPSALSQISLYVLSGGGSKQGPTQLSDSLEIAKRLKIPTVHCADEKKPWPLFADEMLNHQRICAEFPDAFLPIASEDEIIELMGSLVAEKKQGCLGVILDHIQDPHNFGSILRSCAFFNIPCVIFPKDRQTPITPVVTKSSSGGVFNVKLAQVKNINRVLQKLKEVGVWVVGTEMNASHKIQDIPADRAYVFILGHEGKGISHETLKQCDYQVTIAGGNATVDSLNVSVATGICLFELSKKSK